MVTRLLRQALHDEHLDDVADLQVVEALEARCALESLT